jgi:hypothetical protein
MERLEHWMADLSTAVVRLLVVLTGDVCLPLWSASIVSNGE